MPTNPTLVTLLAIRVPDGPHGGFTFAQVRVSCRSGARARALVTSSAVDASADCAEWLAAGWGIGGDLAPIRFERRFDRVRVTAPGFDVSLQGPRPIGVDDVQYVTGLHPVATASGDRLAQVELEIALDRVERGRPELHTFAVPGLDPRFTGGGHLGDGDAHVAAGPLRPRPVPSSTPRHRASSMNTARAIWAAVEPIAASIYFAPEAHAAYQRLGFEDRAGSRGGIEYPDMVAYFTSRGACLGERVSGHLVAAAFGVFKRPIVVGAVAEGWRRTDQAAVLAAREQGARDAAAECSVTHRTAWRGPRTCCRAWPTTPTARAGRCTPGCSPGLPDDPMGAFWRAADLVREHRGDSHIAAWIGADLDACEIGVLTDPWRGQPLKSWVRSRGWTEDELDAAIDRLRGARSARRRGDHGRRVGRCARRSSRPPM